jgi:hypothetical protein
MPESHVPARARDWNKNSQHVGIQFFAIWSHCVWDVTIFDGIVDIKAFMFATNGSICSHYDSPS